MSNFRTVLVCCPVLFLLLGVGCRKKAEERSKPPSPKPTDVTPKPPVTPPKAKPATRPAPRPAPTSKAAKPPPTKVRGLAKLTLDLGNGVTMKLVLIPAGKFVMGSPKTETGHEDAEGPQREVTISKPFYMGVYEVTQSQWEVVMDAKPYDDKRLTKIGPDYPASWVHWNEAMEFCSKLSKKTGKKVTLPTEAQWEYACRGGSKTAYSFGDDSSKLGDYAWCWNNAMVQGERYAHPVGQKKANAFGLYDMHGNVFEWCRDWYDEKFYAKAKNVDPENTTKASYRVLRGGSWSFTPLGCRAAIRLRSIADGPGFCGGFRVVVVSGSGVE